MKKNLGILGILSVVFIATAIGNPNFLTAYNMFNLLERASLYGIIGIGVGVKDKKFLEKFCGDATTAESMHSLFSDKMMDVRQFLEPLKESKEIQEMHCDIEALYHEV